MFLATKLRKYYVIVCLFFILSCLSCLANGKHCTENPATKVTKKPKMKLPKYVMSRALIMLPEYLPLVKQLSIHIVLHILTENFELSYWSICEFSEIQYQSSQRYMWLQNVGTDFCFWGLHVSLLDHHDWWFCSEKILSTFYNFDRNILQHLITHLDDIFSDDKIKQNS